MKRILTVDDSASVRKMVRYTLKGAGYEVVEAADGVDALEKLGEVDIQAMVVDVNMPRMGGMEFLRKVRKIPGFGTTPVIMLTTEAGKELIEEGREAGASGWMVKPFSSEQLVDVINQVLQ
jgi:two-component system chemotaxis response regulator CheY